MYYYVLLCIIMYYYVLCIMYYYYYYYYYYYWGMALEPRGVLNDELSEDEIDLIFQERRNRTVI